MCSVASLADSRPPVNLQWKTYDGLWVPLSPAVDYDKYVDLLGLWTFKRMTRNAIASSRSVGLGRFSDDEQEAGGREEGQGQGEGQEMIASTSGSGV